MLVISALVFLSASAYADFAGTCHGLRKRCYAWAAVLVVLAALERVDDSWDSTDLVQRKARSPALDILYETWNPISRVRVVSAENRTGFTSPNTPPIQSEVVYIDIDNDAATGIYHFTGDLKDVDFLRYEVNSMGARLRAGGSAAVIGVGGGRDVMSARSSAFIASWALRSIPALWMSRRGACNISQASIRFRILSCTMTKAAAT